MYADHELHPGPVTVLAAWLGPSLPGKLAASPVSRMLADALME